MIQYGQYHTGILPSHVFFFLCRTIKKVGVDSMILVLQYDISYTGARAIHSTRRTLAALFLALLSRSVSRERPPTMSSGDAPAAETGNAKTPADFLKSIRGKPVVVKLNSGVDYRGILACLDGYMNIAMEQTEVR